MNPPIRVLAADEPNVVRALGELNDIELVGLVSDGEELLQQAESTKPDIAILDLAMPRLEGTRAIERIAARLPDCKILVLTARHRDTLVVPIVSAGASGYLLKSVIGEQLGKAIDALARGEVYYDPQAIKVLATQLVEK